MSLRVVAAEVYEPALSGEWLLPPRLEIILEGVPDEPTHTELNIGDFSIIHRNWLQSIYCDTWNDEDTTECAAIFNSSMHTEDREPVFPVTVAANTEDGGLWQDFYVKISRVQRILARLERETGVTGYELLPDPTYAAEKRISYTLVHPERRCVECVHEVAQSFAEDEASLVPVEDIQRGCKLVQVAAHRLVPLCSLHTRRRNYWEQSRREERI
ncbi:hypothetical protein SEA_NEOEVIE_82 [Gordonia phage Neoevie]|uniref:Uncharacterized protein n=1 Tax=Gordonia phage Neoevie TaxID=2510574 RepID=A0A411B529_9CAUD|nr:hypothetical protein SEA_NEOEVIE_82 [Gordonia phage Neoevie]